MSDDYYDRYNDEYWENVYNYEMYEEELNESGSPAGVHISGVFGVWLIILVIASNISLVLGEAVIFIGLACWIISKIAK